MTRDQKILDRLQQFCHQPQQGQQPNIIDGYSLGRTLWKAGELRIKPLAPVIKQLLATRFAYDAIIYYSMLWALGRCKEPEGRMLIKRLESKLPNNTEYMYTEVNIALSSHPKAVIPVFDTQLDCLDCIVAIKKMMAVTVDQASKEDDTLLAMSARLASLQAVLLGHYRTANFITKTSQQTQARESVLHVVDHLVASYPFTQIFRRLYKLAEFHDDSELLARLNYRLELSTPSSYAYYVQGLQNPFSAPTKSYFRKRLLRTLKHLAKFESQRYTQAARYVLLQADDHSELMLYSTTRKLAYFPQLSALNFILHRNSRIFNSAYDLHVWSLTRYKHDTEVDQPEAYPEHWNSAYDDLLSLLLGCKAQIVNDFAFRRLHQQVDYLKTISQTNWMLLVQRPYENTALLAFDYLKNALAEVSVLQVILASSFDHLRQQALNHIDLMWLANTPDLLLFMLLSAHSNVYDKAKDALFHAQAHYKTLSNKLLRGLLDSDESEYNRLIPTIEWLLLNPLKQQASLTILNRLLVHSALALQQLAADLLVDSNYSFNQLKDCYRLMSQSEHPQIRAGSIALLAKLPTYQLLSHKTLLLNALTDPHSGLRQYAHRLVLTMNQSSLRKEIFDHILPSLFKAEPAEGFTDDMLQLMVELEPLHARIDRNVVWRLLNAKSKLAMWAGAIILPARSIREFSVKQLVMLSKNPTLSVRDWALDAFDADLSLTTRHYSQAMGLLDNRWDDSRERVIHFFQQRFDDKFWNSERIIAVCDNSYDDVQQLGSALVSRFIDQTHTHTEGEDYLLKLSQHPSANVQLFVSSFLHQYASNQPALIIALEPYFKTVLSQVNRGRLIKDRIIAFLFVEATKEAEVAMMVAALFSDQSISSVIADKMQYIKTLFALQQQFSAIKTPVRRIEPEVRPL